MLKAKGLPNWLWGEAVMTAVYILNRTPTRSVEGATPFELWFGKKHVVQHLHTFGCIAYVKSTRPNLSKLDDRGRKMIFIGYEQGTKAYRFYDPMLKSAHVSRDVVFDEAGQWDWGESVSANEGNNSPFRVEYMVMSTGRVPEEPAAVQEPEPLEFMLDDEPVGSPDAYGGDQEDLEADQPEVPVSAEHLDADHDDAPLRLRSIGNIIGEAAVPGHAVRNVQRLFVVSAEEPASLEEAESQPCWHSSMVEEIKAIEGNHTWELTELPEGRRAIGVKWVFKVKKNEARVVVRHKARLVVKGYSQRQGVDYEEVFAPVARLEAVRLLIALAAHQSWEVHHLDIKSAFLNGELNEEVYVAQPPGFVRAGNEGKVLRLKKVLHGLHQAPRAWN
jgi:hypothetical protein